MFTSQYPSRYHNHRVGGHSRTRFWHLDNSINCIVSLLCCDCEILASAHNFFVTQWPQDIHVPLACRHHVHTLCKDVGLVSPYSLRYALRSKVITTLSAILKSIPRLFRSVEGERVCVICSDMMCGG